MPGIPNIKKGISLVGISSATSTKQYPTGSNVISPGTDGYVLQSDSTSATGFSWVSASGGGGGGSPSGPAGGDLAGTYPNPTLAVITASTTVGSSTVVPVVSIDNKGRVTSLISATITGISPSGDAGGDLTGSYPNPTLATITTAATSGSATIVPIITIDAKGRVITLSSASIQIATSQVTNLDGLYTKTNDLSSSYYPLSSSYYNLSSSFISVSSSVNSLSSSYYPLSSSFYSLSSSYYPLSSSFVSLSSSVNTLSSSLAAVSSSNNGKVAKAGDTMTGNLIISGSNQIGVGGSPTVAAQIDLINPNSATNANFRVRGDGQGIAAGNWYMDVFSGVSGHGFYGYGNKSMLFGTNGTTRMTIDSAGKVGIGTTAPLYPFHISTGYAKTDTSHRYTYFMSSNDAAGSNPFGAIFSIQGAAALGNRLFDITTTDYNSAWGGNLILQKYGGNVGIRTSTTVPSAYLQIAGGTATAGTAPLKFTSGTNLTTPEAGVMEYDGSNLYFTTGSVRESISAKVARAGDTMTGDLTLSNNTSLKMTQGSFYNLTRAMPTAVGNTVEIGTITNTDFAANCELWYNIHSYGFAQSKRYFFPLSYNATAGVWQKVLPISSTGIYFGEDADLEVNGNLLTASLRIRRSSLSVYPSGTIDLTLFVNGSNTTFTPATASATGAATPTTIYPVKAEGFLSDYVGAGVTTVPATNRSLIMASTMVTDAGSYSLNNWNSSTLKVPIYAGVSINNGGATPYVSLPALVLGRQGVNGVAYGNFAEFKMRRWEANGTNARSGLDIALTHGNGDVAGTNIMTLTSNGNVGIGTLTPSASLHLRAGTATAGSAPLKFTSGTNLSAVETGAMEYDGTNLYFSPVASRKIITYRKNVAAATSSFTASVDSCVIASGSFTITLPNPSTVGNGVEIIVKKSSDAASTVTISASAGTIDGATTQSLTTQYSSYTFVSDGSTNWWII